MEILEVYNNYSSLGIISRPITQGEEFDMVQQFIDYRKNSFKPSSTKNLAIFIETKINDAYPDVIFAEFNPSKYDNWTTARNNLSTMDLKLLHYIFLQKKRYLTAHCKRIINSVQNAYSITRGINGCETYYPHRWPLGHTKSK